MLGEIPKEDFREIVRSKFAELCYHSDFMLAILDGNQNSTTLKNLNQAASQ